MAVANVGQILGLEDAASLGRCYTYTVTCISQKGTLLTSDIASFLSATKQYKNSWKQMNFFGQKKALEFQNKCILKDQVLSEIAETCNDKAKSMEDEIHSLDFVKVAFWGCPIPEAKIQRIIDRKRDDREALQHPTEKL